MPFGLLGPYTLYRISLHCSDSIRIQFLKIGDDDKKHKIIGLRNLAKASTAQKLLGLMVQIQGC